MGWGMKSTFSLAVCLLVCVNPGYAASKGIVGVSMPTKASARWIDDGNNMVKYLTEAGYTADHQNAEADVGRQISQIQSMIDKGAKVLVIGAIDGGVLGDALKLKEGKGPFNIELFGGSPDDTNAYYFYDGAMSVLNPYLANGKLVIRSGEKGLNKVATLRWNGDAAKARMDVLLKNHYAKDRVDAVLSPYDGLSIGILTALKNAGYCTAQKPCPFVSGQDAEVPSVKSIIQGEQYSTIFKDTRELAKATVKLVDAVLSGKQPEVNDTRTYNNGAKLMQSVLLKPVAVDKTNYKRLLVDSGYLTEAQLK